MKKKKHCNVAVCDICKEKHSPPELIQDGFRGQPYIAAGFVYIDGDDICLSCNKKRGQSIEEKSQRAIKKARRQFEIFDAKFPGPTLPQDIDTSSEQP